ncbi:MAG TPA: LptF/LptG family permease [Bacteroidales bacterium]|nr:LptF/LptG family permease [Bacteroidales bacterium]HPZ36532.1 LptF/LptG family permease [Bacteroidales bacterium]HQD34856.1 LptF/LptG family permease [Bacteroidales bacterium]
MKIKKIDLYIAKKFISTFLLTITLLIFIIIAFDLSEKIDKFIDKDAPVSLIITQYYLNFIPYFINLFSALFIFISVIFFTSKLANKSEIIAMYSVGIDFKRLLKPYLAVSFLLAIFSFFLQNFILPPANQKRINFENTYVKRNPQTKEVQIHLQLDKNTYLYLANWDVKDYEGTFLSIDKIDYQTGVKQKMMSSFIKYDNNTNKWQLNDVVIREIQDSTERLQRYKTIDTLLPITPSDLAYETTLLETMNFNELNKYIKRQKQRGAENINELLVERQNRYASPFAAIILTIIAVALSINKRRGGLGLNLAIGLALSFGYILFQQISVSYGVAGVIPTFVAAWLPNFIYIIIAGYLLYREI